MRSASILWCAKCMCRLSPGTVNPDIQAPFIFPPAKTHQRAPPWWRPKICTKYRKFIWGVQLSGQTFEGVFLPCFHEQNKHKIWISTCCSVQLTKKLIDIKVRKRPLFALTCKVENILKSSLDLILSPSPSVKIQIMEGTVCLSCIKVNHCWALSTNF